MRLFKSTTKTSFTLDELAVRKDRLALGTSSSLHPSSASHYHRHKHEAKVEITRVEIERGYGSLAQRIDAWDMIDIHSSVTLSVSWKGTERPDQINKFDFELNSLSEGVDGDEEHPIVAEYMLNDVEITIKIPGPRGITKVLRLYFQEEIERQDFLQQIELYVFIRRFRGHSMLLIDDDERSRPSHNTRSSS